MNYTFFKLSLGVLATFGLYSMLYRETKFYRFFEHLFLGLAAGYGLNVAITEVLYETWYIPMRGMPAENGGVATPGYWIWALMMPLGLMAYFVYHERHGWIARVPIGAMLGLWGGQQVQIWFNKFGPQIEASIRPVYPTSTTSFFVPNTDGLTDDVKADIARNVYASQAINNFIFLAILLCVLTYFIFSVDFKSRFVKGMATTGRWSMMLAFGAIFGSTVMTRFALLIDRMYFVWIEWFKGQLLGM